MGNSEFWIHVFGTEWKIKIVPRRKISEDYDTEGLTITASNTIYIAQELSYHRRELVLLHELLHVLFDYCGFSWPDKKEEDFILRVEHPLLEMVKQFSGNYENIRGGLSWKLPKD